MPRRTIIAPVMIGVALAAGACSEPLVPLDVATNLALVPRADSVGLGDSMTVQLRVLNRRGEALPPESVNWHVSDDSILHIWEWASVHARIGGRREGTAWIIASANGHVDSVAVRVVRMGVGARVFIHDPDSGFPDRFGDYVPVDGMCYSSTNQQVRDMHGHDWFMRRLGGFVVDGYGRAMFRRTTEWSYTNPALLHIQDGPIASDILMRPADSNGVATIHIRDGEFTGAVPIHIDGINHCSGIVPRPGLGAGTAASVRETAPGVYVW